MAGWVRVETRFISHPKVLDIGPIGEALWLRGLCYAGEQLTDGFVPVSFLKRMGDMKALVTAERLVAAGLWESADGGYVIHDYLDWQRSKDEATDLHSKRAEAGRLGGKQKASNMLANARQTPSKTDSKTLPDKNREETDTEEKQNLAVLQSPKPPKTRTRKTPADGQADPSADFEARFYGPYPRHVKRDDALRAWAKLSDAERDAAADGLRRWLDAGAFGPDVSYVPYPASWLNARRWSDDVKAVNPPKAAVAVNGFTLEDERAFRKANPLLRVVEP